jgi:hypothetical protein
LNWSFIRHFLLIIFLLNRNQPNLPLMILLIFLLLLKHHLPFLPLTPAVPPLLPLLPVLSPLNPIRRHTPLRIGTARLPRPRLDYRRKQQFNGCLRYH